MVDKSQTDAVFSEGWMWEWLCEYICGHVIRWTMEEFNSLPFNVFAEKMVLDVDMLCACMKFGISCQSDCPLVVYHDVSDLFHVTPCSQIP